MRYESSMGIIYRSGIPILNLHLVVVMHALLMDLHSRKNLDTLYADRLANMDELRDRATRYISIQENSYTRNKVAKVSSTSVLNTTQAFKRMCVSKYDSYTNLNFSKDVIIQEAGGFHGRERENHQDQVTPKLNKNRGSNLSKIPMTSEGRSTLQLEICQERQLMFCKEKTFLQYKLTNWQLKNSSSTREARQM